MNKNLLLIMLVAAFLLMSVVPSHAQLAIGAGIKGGFGLANLAGDVSGTKSRLSFSGGGLLRVSPSPQISIQPEIGLSLKGAGNDYTDGDNLTLTYVELPILVRFSLPSGGGVSPVFMAGPAPGLLLAAKVGDDDIKDEFNTTDIGFVIGTGLDFASGTSGAISLDLRYRMGLSNIVKELGDDSVRNNSLCLFATYIFPLGR